MQETLKGKEGIAVEWIYLDTEKKKAEPYLKTKGLMVPPGIYFLDGSGHLLEMLRGEVKAEQINEVLAKVSL
jgi:hypothetical protein